TRDADLAAGDYAIIVEDLGRNNVQIAYTIALRNTLAVDAGGDFDGAFVREGNDVFTITFDVDTTAAFETGDGAGGCPGDTRMNIFPIVDGARGDAIFDDDAGVGLCSLVNQDFVAGNYAVVIDGFGGGAIDAYVLSVTFAGVCGDGEVNVGEACDDGNVDNGDGCDAACQFEIFCGNGNVDDGEECDDGDADAGDGCDAACQREAVCGDGFVDDPEACDDGNVNPGDGCDPACQFEQVCGNGEVEGTEQCDDGNVDNRDGCDEVCTFEVVDLIDGLEVRAGNQAARGERDDYRFTVDHTPSRLVAFTGDGQGACAPAPNNDTTIAVFPVNPDGTTGERLLFDDDGGVGVCSRLDAELDAGDYLIRVQGFGGVSQALTGYTLDYRLGANVSAGGDFDGAFVQDGDDLFTFSTDAASTVLLETGDGAGGCPNDTRMELFRIDENGVRADRVFNDDSGVGACSLISSDLAAGTYVVRVDGFGNRAIDAYILNVQFIVCGDGAVGGGEECDDGNVDAGDGCAADCTIEPGCGNGRIELDEACDDGNLDNGDGCDDQCQFEVFCGNGNVDAGEACDDGNLDAGDGCSADCQFEQVCGNGAVEGTEQCDDGNVDNGDGCDALCTFEVVALPLGREVREGATVQGQRDDYTFTVDHTQARVVVFTGDGADGCPAGNDTTIAIFPVNADGTAGDRLFFDDDGGAGLCSRLDEQLDAGDYLVRVQGFGANPNALAGYTFEYRQTVNVAAGGDFDGAFVQSGNDLYEFTVEADTTGTFQTNNGAGGCPGDTRMFVFSIVDGARGDQRFFDDDGGAGTCSQLTDVALPAGTYVVLIDGFGGRAIPDYTLTVTFPIVEPVCGDGTVDAGEECDDGNLDNGDGCDAECSNEFFVRDRAITAQRSRMAAGSSDTFQVVLDNPGRILFYTSDGAFGCPADTRGRLFAVDQDGVRVAQVGPDVDDGFNPIAPECAGALVNDLPAGTYEIEIAEQADGAIAAYQVNVLVASNSVIESSTAGTIPVGGTDGYFFQVADVATELAIFTDTAADGTCNRDTVMQVFTISAATGQLTPVVDDDDGGVGACSRVQVAFEPGNYVVVINEFGNNGAIEDYNLNVECISCVNAARPALGQLVITEIMQNPSAVPDGDGEYFEVENVGDTDVDAFGMILADNDNDAHRVTESVVIAAGEFAVFARNADPATNGGFDADYVYADFFLANGSDEVVLRSWRGNELDRVDYDDGATFPDPNGASMQFGGAIDDDNANGDFWCESGVAFGAGDSGTPGEANEGCDNAQN
ncbi:MAG: cysteine-rich repeat protein, partial [Bradymonadia bacterium]